MREGGPTRAALDGGREGIGKWMLRGSTKPCGVHRMGLIATYVSSSTEPGEKSLLA